MKKNNNIEPFEISNRIDGTRRELDDKIEKKLDKQTAFLIITLLVGITGGILVYAFNQINVASDRIDQLDKRITILETVINNKSSHFNSHNYN